MIDNISISIYLDTRREKANGKFPVKLRVFVNNPRKQKFYPTKYDFSQNEFDKIFNSKKLNQQNKDIKMDLLALESKAHKIASKIDPFDFDSFENVMFNYSGNLDNAFMIYNDIVKDLRETDRVGSAESYELSMKSIKVFIGAIFPQYKGVLGFRYVTPQFLHKYEKYMTDQGKSLTTVGIYLRCLRAVYNKAIDKKIVDVTHYPFGKKKYQIPAPRKTKKALSKEQLSLLFHAKPGNKEQAKAKDLFFFSYSCNGMNFKDIANLQYKNYDGETIQFCRAKTKNTQRDQAPVVVYLNDYIKSIILKYGNKVILPDNYIFDIVDHTLDADKQRQQLKNFIRAINQSFTTFANNNGISGNISSYWARHSFATNAIRSGASMEFVSEALSHSNLKTTQNYFAGFADEAKKDISNKLMDL
ncbi:MAG: site-specific integrase [Weeksellaceae bacterium]|nr:site-specific integrase [Weeksellaceae bacterium]